ncbi:HEPN domain-containing protein [Melittangium boletus]|uniref:HEPN domain-containing protein n=1 Tax=Melittangium boletus TaxID=83453 RepID=UPI003DA1D56B
MDPILEEFKRDLNRIQKLLELVGTVKSIHSLSVSDSLPADDFSNAAKIIHTSVKDSHADFVVMTGTLALYLAGRFEYFVRNTFQELCDKIAKRCGSFDRLPRAMRQSLMEMTAEVVKNPRKYGHADKGAEAFMKTLAENLSDKSRLTSINSECISITYENMRPDTLKELFERIGVTDLWDRISNQAKVMAFFDTAEPPQARAKAIALLNAFMNDRNMIAHPSGTVTWPDQKGISEYVEFLGVLSEALSDLSSVFERKFNAS